MWEQTLNRRPVDFIKSTCCNEIAYNDFCVDAGGKPPKLLKWKCHTRDENNKPLCTDCGTNKKFRLTECNALQECETVIPVKEWKLAPRTKDKEGNVTSTQIEPFESKHPISEVITRLKLQLETCRTQDSMDKLSEKY